MTLETEISPVMLEMDTEEVVITAKLLREDFMPLIIKILAQSRTPLMLPHQQSKVRVHTVVLHYEDSS